MVIFSIMGYIIYKSENKLNNKVYIGCTTNGLKRRMREHKYRCEKGIYKSKFCSAIRKYGFDNFDFTIIEECSDEKTMFDRESYYIGLYDTKNNGYNLTDGGEGCLGYEHSDETKILISELLSQNHPSRGKTYDDVYGFDSEKQRKLRSEATKKYWDSLSPEEKERRVIKFKENGRKAKESGSLKCGKNPFSKSITINNKTFGCWSEAIEVLGMSKYLIKKNFKIDKND